MPPRSRQALARASAARRAPRPRRRAPALPDGRRLGLHLALGEGMLRAAERARVIGAETIQVFADNPTAWRRREAPQAELPEFRQRLAELGIEPIAIHASYLVNLAGPDEELFRRSVDLLASELQVAPAFGARFVNVHVGSHRGSGVEAGIARVAEGVALALAEAPGAPDGPLLVLENSAGNGFGIGVTVEELAAILEAAAARGVDPTRIAFCLDTAHAWGGGHDISAPEGVDALLAEMAARLGSERLVMVHLNDSKVELGSRVDRHEHIGAGRIGPAGLARLLEHPALAGAAYYLETPGMDDGFDRVNLRRVRDLAAGRPLPPLPRRARARKRGASGARHAGQGGPDAPPSAPAESDDA